MSYERPIISTSPYTVSLCVDTGVSRCYCCSSLTRLPSTQLVTLVENVKKKLAALSAETLELQVCCFPCLVSLSLVTAQARLCTHLLLNALRVSTVALHSLCCVLVSSPSTHHAACLYYKLLLIWLFLLQLCADWCVFFWLETLHSTRCTCAPAQAWRRTSASGGCCRCWL
jgi:hypothetical protein